jgi:hypothetical protein
MYIAKNLDQHPIDVRVNHEGIASTIDLGVHLRISRMGVRPPKNAKISKDQKRALSWKHNALYRAVIFMLAQEGHYVVRVAHLGLTVNSRNANSLYSRPFDTDGEVNTDDAVCHLARNGRPMDWAAHESVVTFARSYLREWIHQRVPTSRDDIQLRHIYTMLYPEPPQVELLNPAAPTNEQLEVIPRSAVEPPAVVPHAHAPQSPAPSSGSELFRPNVNMNVPEYPDEPEFTLDPRAEDEGPSGI